jgi:signal recognition particle subunit SRP54
MFAALTEKLEATFKRLRGHGRLTDANIRDAMKEVRQALLEADVHYKVVRDFIKNVEEKSIGTTVLQSVDPGQQVVKIVHDELVALLGSTTSAMAPLEKMPTVYMLCGLQGSGKTTLAGKLALQAKKKGKKPLLVAADIYRPAAVKQLQVLAESIEVPSFSLENSSPQEICKQAISWASKNFIDLAILDTAGRLAIDAPLMQELEEIKRIARPQEIILVVDAMTGQDALGVAEKFNMKLQLTGVAMTKLDGDARGGAALSIRKITGCPIKLISTGEKLTDLEPFHPDRLASRILGMGDIVSLVEKAQEEIDRDTAVDMQQKLMTATFDLNDFQKQILQIKKLGPLQSVLGMIPGMGKAVKNVDVDDKELDRILAIIRSMTMKERSRPKIIDGSRKRRIATGSGTSVQEINALLNQFTQMQRMFGGIARDKGRIAQMAKTLRAGK